MAEIVFEDGPGCPSGQTTTQELARMEAAKSADSEALRSYVQTKQNGNHAIDLMISGAHCAGCLAKIEREASALPGVKSSRMNLSTMRLSTEWEGGPERVGDIVARLEAIGYGAKPFNMELEPTEQKDELKSLLIAMGVAGFAMVNIMLLSVSVWFGVEMSESTRHVMHMISGAIALPAVAFSGRPFFKSAIGALKNKTTNMDVPISLAVILACSLSVYETFHNNQDTYFDAAVMLLFLLLIGRYLDTRLRLKTGESAQRLAAMQASSARRIDPDGSIHEIAAHLIKPDDLLMVAAGERIPVDGEIIKGHSEIDTSIATGETLPRSNGPGDRLYSGMINLSAPITLKALAVSGDSFLSEISKLVEAGEQKKGKFVRIADRAARAYVPVVHSLSLMTFVGWLLVGGDLRTAALNAIAVLIITCPCALGLAVPAVQIVASGRLFKKGVLIKSGDALERLAQVDTVVFDKTGTLTLGTLELINGKDIDPELLALAAKLARASRHPIARAVVQYVGPGLALSGVQEIAGKGLMADIDGKPVKFGSADFVRAKTSQDATVSYLKVGAQKPIPFVFKDQPRMDAKATVERLLGLGYQVLLLSGDRKDIARDTAQALGIDKWIGEISPQEKLAKLEELTAQGHHSLMVGDGINDAPSLAAAHVSASPASAADVSRASADIILQGDKLSGLLTALTVSKQADRRVKENLGAAIAYNMIAVPLAVFGFVNPLIAAAAMSGSSMIVTLNALRIRND